MLAKILLTIAFLGFLTIAVVVAAYQFAYLLVAFICVAVPLIFLLWLQARKEAKGEKSRKR